MPKSTIWERSHQIAASAKGTEGKLADVRSAVTYQPRAAGTQPGALRARILALVLGQFATMVRTQVRNPHGANPGAVMVFQRRAEQRLLLLFKLTEASTWLNST